MPNTRDQGCYQTVMFYQVCGHSKEAWRHENDCPNRTEPQWPDILPLPTLSPTNRSHLPPDMITWVPSPNEQDYTRPPAEYLDWFFLEWLPFGKKQCQPFRIGIAGASKACERCTPGHTGFLPAYTQEQLVALSLQWKQGFETLKRQSREEKKPNFYFDYDRYWNRANLEDIPLRNRAYIFDGENPASRFFERVNPTDIPEEDICVICHQESRIGDPRKLPCGHVYNQECIVSWMNIGHNSCPLDTMDPWILLRPDLKKKNFENFEQCLLLEKNRKADEERNHRWIDDDENNQPRDNDVGFLGRLWAWAHN